MTYKQCLGYYCHPKIISLLKLNHGNIKNSGYQIGVYGQQIFLGIKKRPGRLLGSLEVSTSEKIFFNNKAKSKIQKENTFLFLCAFSN